MPIRLYLKLDAASETNIVMGTQAGVGAGDSLEIALILQKEALP